MARLAVQATAIVFAPVLVGLLIEMQGQLNDWAAKKLEPVVMRVEERLSR